jgi:lipid-A-disaccharide synthase
VVATPPGIGLPRVFAGVPNVVHAPGRATESLLACDAAIVKSGTATLEAAVCNAPQLVVYDGPPLFRGQYLLLRKRGKIPFAAMPNIIAGRLIVPELLGPDCSAPRLASELLRLLDGDSAGEMRENYLHVRRALGESLPQTATMRTVVLIEELVASTVEFDRTSF